MGTVADFEALEEKKVTLKPARKLKIRNIRMRPRAAPPTERKRIYRDTRKALEAFYPA
jgi:hypothetical protein